MPGLELLEMFKKLNGEDAGHLDLSALGPLDGADVLASIRLRRELYDRHGLPYGAGPVPMSRHSRTPPRPRIPPSTSSSTMPA